MRYVKRIVLAVFILCAAVFGFAEVKGRMEQDTTEPVIESTEEEIQVSCEYTEEEFLRGLTASDEKDGDLTSRILVGEVSRFIEKGVSNVTYVVFDSSDQAASLTRKVRFTDYESPKFTLTEPLVFHKGQGDMQEVRDRIGVQDQLDGNLKDWMIQKESNISFQNEGDYFVEMEVSNSYGDTSTVKFPVHIREPQTLKVQLTGSIAYVKAGQTFSPEEWLAGAYDAGGNPLERERVSINSTVDVNTPGTYEVNYHAFDEINSGDAWLTVVVFE